MCSTPRRGLKRRILASQDNRREQLRRPIGGPIRKDHTSSSSTTKAIGTELALAGFMTLPTSAMKNGDFRSWLGAQVGTDALGRPVFKNEIYDPTTTRNVTAGQVDGRTGLTANAERGHPRSFQLRRSLNVIPPVNSALEQLVFDECLQT